MVLINKKIVALTETGYRISAETPPVADWFSNYLYTALSDNLTFDANIIEVNYVMFWNNDNNGYYVPNGSVSNSADFKTFAEKPKSALLNSLPKMYELPK